MCKDDCCYLCNECPASFQSLDLLEQHIDQGLHLEPMDTVEKPTEMQEECVSIESASAVSTPMAASPNKPQSADDIFPCQLCARTFADRDQLNTHHVHTHRQKPNYVCEVCNMEFGIKRDKQTHMRIHAGEMPQKCLECGKEFGTRQLLKKHQMWHTGKRSHVCQQCGKSFFQRGHLSQHYQIHKNVRPFACSLCEKTFIFKFDLNRHMKIHAERGYCCHKCNKSFARQSALDEHNCKKPSPKKSITKLVGSPLSDFSQAETVTMNSPSTVSQQSPLVAPLSPGDVKKDQSQFAELPQQNMLRMAQMLMAQAQQRSLLNAQNFLIQQQQAANPATSTASSAPLNLAGLNQLQLSVLLQQYRQQQLVQSNFHCSVCAVSFDNQAAYVLHCNQTHFNNAQQNLIPSSATEVLPVPQPEIPQTAMSNTLLAQMLSRAKEEQFESTTTSSSCASSPQKISPTQSHTNADWLTGCLRTHSNSPPCEKCVEYQSKYTELESNYSQARAELDRLKSLMGQLGTMTNLLNLQRAAN